MKIRIVFEQRNFTNSGGDLLYKAIVGDDGMPIDHGLIGEWITDGDVEALCLDVLPPLDKVTLTVVEPTGKMLPNNTPPIYEAAYRAALVECRALRRPDGTVDMSAVVAKAITTYQLHRDK